MITLKVLFILLFSFPVIAGSQVNYGIRQYSTENGLPSNGIKGLQWDETTGFLWIATEAGMVRFNGMEFQSFNVENARMASDRMLFLVRNHPGQIYTADQGGNIFTIEKIKVKFVEKYGGNGLQAENLFLYSTSPSILKKYRLAKPGWNFNLPFDQLLTVNDTAFYVLRNGALYYHSFNQHRQIVPENLSKKLVSLVRINEELFVFDAGNNLYQ